MEKKTRRFSKINRYLTIFLIYSVICSPYLLVPQIYLFAASLETIRVLKIDKGDTVSQALVHLFPHQKWKFWGKRGTIAKLQKSNPCIKDLNRVWPGTRVNLTSLNIEGVSTAVQPPAPQSTSTTEQNISERQTPTPVPVPMQQEMSSAKDLNSQPIEPQGPVSPIPSTELLGLQSQEGLPQVESPPKEPLVEELTHKEVVQQELPVTEPVRQLAKEEPPHVEPTQQQPPTAEAPKQLVLQEPPHVEPTQQQQPPVETPKQLVLQEPSRVEPIRQEPTPKHEPIPQHEQPREHESPQEPYGWFEAHTHLFYSRLDSTDTKNNATATYISNLNPGVSISWNQHWSDRVETAFDIGYRRENYSYLSTALVLQNGSQNLSNFGLQFRWKPFSTNRDLSIFSGLQMRQELFSRGLSTTATTLDAVAIPEYNLGVKYDIVNFNSLSFSALAEGFYLFPASSNYTIQSGTGYQAGLQIKQTLNSKFSFFGDIDYSYRSQDTSIATKKETSIGFELGITFRPGTPVKTKEE